MLLLFSSIIGLKAQYMVHLQDGTYQFGTPLPESDLHFYLYGDGYHSFEKINTHEYSPHAIGTTAKLFHAEPYDDGDVQEFVLGDVEETEVSSEAVDIDFQNQIEVKRSWNLVEGRNNFYMLMFENSQYDEAIGGCVEFHFNSAEIDINEAEVLDKYGNDWVSTKIIGSSDYPEFTDKFTWFFSDLDIGEQRFIYIPGKCLLETMSKIDTRGVMKVTTCGETIPYSSKTDGSNEDIFDSQIYTLESIVSTNPHDPNYIDTDPECLATSDGSQTIEYTVVFQNEGLTPVVNVDIDIDLDGYYTSITLLSASHDCSLEWDNVNNNIFINFPFINLPGMGQVNNPPLYEETIGWVKLALCYEYVTPDDCTISDGEIIFDDEAPIPISHELCYGHDCDSDISSIECPYGDYLQNIQYFDSPNNKLISSIGKTDSYKFSLVPNPVIDFINIETTEFNEVLNIKVFDGTNRLLKELDLLQISKNNIINVEDLKSGTYYMVINNGLLTETIRFIKI